MNTYEVVYEKFDYFFAKSTVCKTDFFVCASADEAKTLAHWNLGDLINILSIEEFE